MDVPAVGALPDHDAGLFKDLLGVDVFEQGAVTLFMFFFDLRDHLKQVSDLIKALFLCVLGKVGIHIGPLIVLTSGRIREVGSGVTDAAEQFEPDFRVLFLVRGSFQEQIGDLDEAFFLGFGSIVGVFVASLGFAGKCGQQVGFCLGALEFFHVAYLFLYAILSWLSIQFPQTPSTRS